MLGDLYVLPMILIAGRVGAAAFMGLTVTAAVMTSISLDHFGWPGSTFTTPGRRASSVVLS